MAKQERKLPERLEHDFIICDNTVNRYRWRLLVEGIELGGFLKNPVCCVQHGTSMIPVGKWKNLRVESGELRGTVEFDRYDAFAVRLYWKYSDGYMNAVSLHVIPIEESDDEALLLPGQKYPTMTKSELLEISLVTIPGQKNAVKLSTPDGTEYKLDLLTNTSKTMAKEDEKTVKQLQDELQEQKRLNATNLIKLHQQRGVISEGEVEPLKALAFDSYENVSKMLEARKAPEEEGGGLPAETLADTLVKLHVDRGAITEAEGKIYRLAAISDYEGTRKGLEAKPGTDALKGFVQGMGGTPADASKDERAEWTYLDWYKKDMPGLLKLQKAEPEKYKRLEADFAEESRVMGIGVPAGE